MGVFDGWGHAKRVVRNLERLTQDLDSYKRMADEQNWASAAIWADHVADRYELIAGHLEASWLARRAVKPAVLANARPNAAWWRGESEELWKRATVEVRD